MQPNLESKDIEQLLAEADELIEQINSDAFREREEEHRLQIEMRAQKLKTIKSEVQEKIKEKKDGWKLDSALEGMYEAYREIEKAIRELKKHFS